MSEFRELAATISEDIIQSVFPSIYKILDRQSENEERVYQEARKGIERSNYFVAEVNRELETALFQIETLENLTGRLLAELNNASGNIKIDWDSEAGGLFGGRAPKPKGTAKPGAQKLKPKSRLGGAGGIMTIFSAVTFSLEAISRIKALDPNDPEYYSKARNEVVALTARFGVSTIAAVLGAIVGTAIVPGFGTIFGLATGLVAGMYVDYAFGDDVEEMTKQLLEYIFKDDPKKMPQKKETSEADLPSKNATPVSYDPSESIKLGITRLSDDEITNTKDNILQSLVEGNFRSLNFDADTILFDADVIDWGVAGAPGDIDGESAGGRSREGEDVSRGDAAGSKMPGLAGPRRSGSTQQGSGASFSENRTVKPSSGITSRSGGSAGSTGSGKDWSGHTYTGDNADILATIRQRESGGDYGARSKSSTASGAYQFINSTWRGLTQKFGIGTEYRTAADAPPNIQDAVAAEYVKDILRRNNNDLSKVPLEWYTGNSAGQMSASALAANNGLTPQTYVDKWMQDYMKISGKTPEMMTNNPQTGGMMNATAVAQNARAYKESQAPAMLPTMARSPSSANQMSGSKSSAGVYGTGREPTAADLFRQLFSIPVTR